MLFDLRMNEKSLQKLFELVVASNAVRIGKVTPLNKHSKVNPSLIGSYIPRDSQFIVNFLIWAKHVL